MTRTCCSLPTLLRCRLPCPDHCRTCLSAVHHSPPCPYDSLWQPLPPRCSFCLHQHTQTDILSSAQEVEEVVSFVRSNAARVLGVDEPQVLPVRCGFKGAVLCGSKLCSCGRPALTRRACVCCTASFVTIK